MILHHLDSIQGNVHPVILTIGKFDGMHLGHQFLFNEIESIAKSEKKQRAIITFENHPSHILTNKNTVCLINTLPHRIKLLTGKAEFIIAIPFTKEFSEQTPKSFLSYLEEKIPFSSLVLGHDATIGKNRQGTKEQIQSIAKQLGFSVVYLPPFQINDITISSSKIRKAIENGELENASMMLGRPYSIYGEVISGQGRGTTMGFPTANIDVSNLCLPPFGVYAVEVITQKNSTLQGIANLGIAPTVRQNHHPLLEVHLLDAAISLYGQNIEVIFRQFIRPEIKFASINDLKLQIKKDIKQLEVI